MEMGEPQSRLCGSLICRRRQRQNNQFACPLSRSCKRSCSEACRRRRFELLPGCGPRRRTCNGSWVESDHPVRKLLRSRTGQRCRVDNESSDELCHPDLLSWTLLCAVRYRSCKRCVSHLHALTL